MLTRAGWYGQNSARIYPLADNVTGVDVNGQHFPENVIVDLKIRFTGGSVEKAYISKLTVGDFISVVVSVSGEDIAALSMFRKDIVPGRPLKMDSTGRESIAYIVFGELYPAQNFSLSFTSAAASGLSAVAAYPQYGTTTSRRFGVNGRRIDGLRPSYVVGGKDVQVVEKKLDINGLEVLAIVFEMTTDVTLVLPDVELDNTTATQLKYAGPCGKRPESRSCDDPQPVETINGVTADCCGRIFVELRGCGDIYPIEDHCGVAIACPFTAEDACPTPTNVPTPTGVLPGEGPDDCEVNADTGTIPATSDQNILPQANWWAKE